MKLHYMFLNSSCTDLSVVYLAQHNFPPIPSALSDTVSSHARRDTVSVRTLVQPGFRHRKIVLGPGRLRQSL